VHGFTDSQCIRDLQDKIVEIALAEGPRPLGIFKDKFDEETNFPTLFYGDPCATNITEKFSYHKIIRWEMLHSSGDFSCHITNLFLKTMRIMIEQFLSFMWVRIRKGQLQGRNLLAKDVKYKVNLEKTPKSNIRYIDFKNIHTSPHYLQQNKKSIFVMIWQLGPLTFFITFTSAEHCWDPLVAVIFDLHRNKKRKKQTDTLENNDINYLIRKDPVACTHYYRHRINALRQLICHDETFFRKISD
jgi:hypothetical protein